MQRHGQIIELSDHVKNKLKRHQRLSTAATPSLINSSDEFIEINSTDDENELDSPRLTPLENITTRQRRDTFTIDEVKHSSDLFFTDTKSNQNPNVSILEEKYRQQQQCQECHRRERIIHLQRQDLIRICNQNKQLHHQLRSSASLNHQYENDIRKLKHHLSKVNSHLYEYQTNFVQLKQKILSEKKSTPKIDEHEEEEEELTIDHVKRLRHEIQMYNRLVAAKEKQEERNGSEQTDFFF